MSDELRERVATQMCRVAGECGRVCHATPTCAAAVRDFGYIADAAIALIWNEAMEEAAREAEAFGRIESGTQTEDEAAAEAIAAAIRARKKP